MAILILGLVLFIGTHSVSIVSLPWRDRMAARLGANGWRAKKAFLELQVPAVPAEPLIRFAPH